jgi:LytS/YehU family sensor histidine kinase
MMALGAYQNKIGSQKLLLKNQKERLLLITELELLRNQFNSNITFDFLKLCQDQVRNNSSDIADGIAIFSSMLRYSTNIKSNEKVPLFHEIEYIKNFISLQKLLNSATKVELSIEGDCIAYTNILPRILIGFVENAFKHGDTVSHEIPVLIELKSSMTELSFRVSNKKSTYKKFESSGIGNYNLKQHLELFYKNRYSLEIKDSKDVYISQLKLSLL